MRRINLFSAKVEELRDRPEGYAVAAARLAPHIGAAMVGATIYELAPEQSSFPYHYEYGNEEWVVVISGRPSLRHPHGEDELEPGDVVCFPPGPEGAHKLTNRTEAPVRFLILSTKREPGVAVYPDSDKIGLWPGEERDEIMVRRASSVDYWDGER